MCYDYSFLYNDFGRRTDTKIGSRTLSSNVYNDAKGLLDSTTYGNGITVKYGYDDLNRQTSTTVNNVLRYKKLYDGQSRISQIEDFLIDRKIKYEYDILGRVVSETIMDTLGNNVNAKLGIRYGDKGTVLPSPFSLTICYWYDILK